MSFEGSGEWMNPPPPGTVDEQPVHKRDRELAPGYSRSPHEETSASANPPPQRSRSRSRSHDRYSKHRRRRSQSREYRRRRSRSRSSSRKRYEKRYSHKYRSRYSRSSSRNRSRRHRRSYSRSHSSSPHKKHASRSRSFSTSSNSEAEGRHRMEVLKNQEYTRKVYSKRKSKEVEEEEDSVQENSFKNDGSFLEMFKKMQQQMETKVPEPEPSASDPKPSPMFGKRRGGRVLKTGMVQKLKNPNEMEDEPKDAWSVYMKEVRKYKEACCDDDSKTRPLVK